MQADFSRFDCFVLSLSFKDYIADNSLAVYAKQKEKSVKRLGIKINFPVFYKNGGKRLKFYIG